MSTRRHTLPPALRRSGSLLLVLALYAPVQAGPKIACRNPVHDFGTCASTSLVSHEFEIRNEGDAPLLIGNLRGCCGGTITIRDKVIAPGSNTVCTAGLALVNREGKQSKSYYIASNDPGQPYFQLLFSGVVTSLMNTASSGVARPAPATNTVSALEDVVVVPREILLPPTADNPAPITRYVALKSRTGKTFRIIKVEPPEPGITVQYEPVTSGGYRIILGNIMPFEELHGKDMLILTDHAEAARITVRFRVTGEK